MSLDSAQLSACGDIIQLACEVYKPHHANEVRSNLTNQLVDAVSALGSSSSLELGMSMLQVSEDVAGPQTTQVRAYGAVVLKQAVITGRLQVDAANPEAMLSWLSHEASLPPAIRHAVGNLVVVCAVRLFPEKWPSFVERLLSPDLSEKPHMLPLIKDFADACVEPPVSGSGDVPPSRMRAIRTGLKAAAPGAMKAIILCMHAWYQKACCCPSGQSDAALNFRYVNMGLGVLNALAATMPSSKWWELGLHEVVRTLVQSDACRKDAVALAGALIRTPDHMLPSDPVACAFVSDVVQVVEPAIQLEDWELVQEILDTVADIPAPMAEQVLQGTLVTFTQLVLDVPSVQFGVAAADLFKKMMISHTARPLHLSITQPMRLLQSMSFLAQKHAVHPSFARSACTRSAANAALFQRAITFSQEQFPTLRAFETTYADLRGSMAAMLQYLGVHFPSECAAFCAHVLASLPTSRYTYDPMTRIGGYAQQSSQTFSEWNAAQFVLDHLAPSTFTQSSLESAGLAAFKALVKIAPPRDAVLIPTFLNMLLSFWEASKGWTDASANIMWVSSCDLLFRFMGLLPDPVGHAGGSSHNNGGGPRRYHHATVNLDDIDLVAARKRAYTAFVHAAVHHGSRLVCVPDLYLLAECQKKLVEFSTLSTEKAFLYEAVASLSNFMDPEEQRRFLDAMISTMRNIVVNTNAANVIGILCDPSLRDQRAALRDSVAVLASVLRRCNASPYTQSMAMEIIPVMGNLLLTIHSARAQDVPPAYQSLFDLSHVDRDQLLNGGAARRSSVVSGLDSNDVGRARHALQHIRLYLYQALGAMGKFVALESFTQSLMQTVQHCGQFEIHTMRAFAENTLFKWIQCSLPMASFIFPSLAAFFVAQRAKDERRSSHDEVVDFKQLFYFTKDTVGAVSTVVETSNWFLLPGVNIAVLQLLEVLVQAAFDFRGTAGAIVRYIENSLFASPQDAARCFCNLAETCASPRSPVVVAEKDVEMISGQLCMLYTTNMDLYGSALIARGVPEDLLNTLNANLSLASRIDMRRRAFRDFLSKAGKQRQ